MKKIVLVDIDGTLIDDCGKAKPQILSAVIGHIQDGDYVYFWSIGGINYVNVEIDKIFGKVLPPFVCFGKAEEDSLLKAWSKNGFQPDVCYDDQPESIKEQAERYKWDLSKITIIQPTTRID